jgi:uncharacterized protein (UPF0248 family)
VKKVKKFISIIIYLFLCLTFTQSTVFAKEENENTQKYIVEMTFAIQESYDIDYEHLLSEQGYQTMRVDDVFLGYKTSSNSDNAITGMKVFTDRSEIDIDDYGITYHLIKSYQGKKTKINFYVTYDKLAGSPIQNISMDDIRNCDGWYTVSYNNTTNPMDMCTPNSEKELFFHYQRDPNYVASTFSTTELFLLMGGIVLVVCCAITLAFVRDKKNIKKRKIAYR